MRAPAVPLDELLARRAAHPAELAAEAQRRAVPGVVRALVLVRGDARVDAGLAAGAGARAAARGGAGEDADGDALVARAEEGAATRVGAVDAFWGVVLGLAGGVGCTLGTGEVPVEDVFRDDLATAARGEGREGLERGLNEGKKTIDVVLVSTGDTDRVVVHEPNIRLTSHALVSRAVAMVSEAARL